MHIKSLILEALEEAHPFDPKEIEPYGSLLDLHLAAKAHKTKVPDVPMKYIQFRINGRHIQEGWANEISPHDIGPHIKKHINNFSDNAVLKGHPKLEIIKSHNVYVPQLVNITHVKVAGNHFLISSVGGDRAPAHTFDCYGVHTVGHPYAFIKKHPDIHTKGRHWNDFHDSFTKTATMRKAVIDGTPEEVHQLLDHADAHPNDHSFNNHIKAAIASKGNNEHLTRLIPHLLVNGSMDEVSKLVIIHRGTKEHAAHFLNDPDPGVVSTARNKLHEH